MQVHARRSIEAGRSRTKLTGTKKPRPASRGERAYVRLESQFQAHLHGASNRVVIEQIQERRYLSRLHVRIAIDHARRDGNEVDGIGGVEHVHAVLKIAAFADFE